MVSRPFFEQGIHEIAWRIFKGVDPIWFDVTRLVCKGWLSIPLVNDCSDKLVIRLGKRSRDYVIRNCDSDLYIRADKRARVHGWRLHRIETKCANTYTRSRRCMIAYKYFTINDGIIGKCHSK